ncbi:MAG: hydroxyacid dehydrogenase, partial [Cyclobacteriaceae bacterium]|nr:hydroxyacid dehydrogenase [Cyclobacteriaceae bacterium]
MMEIVILDAKTLGKIPNLEKLSDFGNVISYETTSPRETISRIADAEIIITNKVVIDKNVMKHCPRLKLICISATGMNNVDLETARQKGIEVKNAVGYSS